MPETDLYMPVKRFLEAQGYVVKGEIKECDVVAVRADEPPVIVELKKSFSLQLLMQGIDRLAITDAVYLAIVPPKRRQFGDMLKLCKRLGLGVLLVSGDHVEALCDPAPYQPRKAAARKRLLLKEFVHRVGDTTSGGSARGPRMTAYRQNALRCAAFISKNGPSKPAEIRKAGAVEKAPAILLADVYGWFMRVERGVYGLSLKGESAVSGYAPIVTEL